MFGVTLVPDLVPMSSSDSRPRSAACLLQTVKGTRILVGGKVFVKHVCNDFRTVWADRIRIRVNHTVVKACHSVFTLPGKPQKR